MEKNKTGKYLKYAIGEIVLVVIGILIALSINNWNETRKLERKKQELVLNLIIVGITIWTLATIGWDAWSEEFVRKWNEGLQNNRQ